MILRRTLTSVWYVAILLVSVWFGDGPGFTALITVFASLAAFEFYRMVAKSKTAPLTVFGIIWTIFFTLSRNSEILCFLEGRFNSELLNPLLLTSAIVIPLIYLLFRRHKEEAFTSWLWTVAGILYIGWLLSHLVALRDLDYGRNWVFFILFVTWISDTTAFFVGRRFGRRKLAPLVSPSKTWEGTIGGIGGAIAVSALFVTPTVFRLPLLPWQAIVLSILTSALGQAGDLVESLLKRNVGVKDSGKLMPGHGGILDRIDSLLFAGIVIYYYAAWVG